MDHSLQKNNNKDTTENIPSQSEINLYVLQKIKILEKNGDDNKDTNSNQGVHLAVRLNILC